MGKKTYGFGLVEFLCDRNVIMVTNNLEFEAFKSTLEKIGLINCLGEYTTFNKMQELALIKNKNPSMFLFGYDNNKGLTWGDRYNGAIEWYGVKPLKAIEVYNEINQ